MKKSEAIERLSKMISPVYQDKALYDMMNMSDEEWELIIKVANRHMLIPLLYASLKEKGCFPYIQDGQLLGYLKEMYKLNGYRNEKIIEQVKEITDLFYKKLAIETVLLKGVAALSESHYTTMGERFMMDIDLLVPEDKLYATVTLLKENGYLEISDTPHKPDGHWHHYDRLYHKDKMTSVEIHRYALGQKSTFVDVLEDKKYLSKSTLIPHSYVIEPTYEVIHSFLHTQISHSYHKNYFLPLRHIQHASVMLEHYSDEIDMTVIEKFMQDNHLSQIWDEYVYMMQKLFVLKFNFKEEEIKKVEGYYEGIQKYLDTSHKTSLKSKLIYKKVQEVFSSYHLMDKYNYKSRNLTPLFVLIHFPVVVSKFVFKQKSRDLLYTFVKTLSS